jgi:hypothetical protein
MTMHLVGPYLTTTNYKKRKQKPRTKSQQDKFEQNHREFNKSMRRIGCHDKQMTLQDYDLYVRGLYRPKLKESKQKNHRPDPYMPTVSGRDTSKYTSLNSMVGSTAKKEPQWYTGERRLLGIATMHKSCLVPVFEDGDGTGLQQAADIAKMRR